MERWLRALLFAVPAPFRPAAGILIDALIRVFQWARRLGARGRDGLRLLVVASGSLFLGLRELGYQVYHTLRWMLVTHIPAVARWAIGQATRWAREVIRATRVALLLAIGNLRRAALQLIFSLSRALNDLGRFTFARLARLTAQMTRVLRHVFGVLDTPQRLVQWVVGAMWLALWRFAWANLDRYADAIWKRRRRILLRTVAETERILGRLL